MATTIQATLQMAAGVIVTRDDIESIGSFSTPNNQFDHSATLNASSTPPVTKKFADRLTGTNNLDFTALADPELGTQDMSGLKLQILTVYNRSTTDALVLSDNAATPYSINNTNDLQVPIGGRLVMFFNDQLADVAAGAKLFDVECAVGESCDIILVFG
jgi:hypothetical protein